MGNLIADIFVTIKPTEQRRALTRQSLKSLLENTDRTKFRLTLCIDGGDPWSLGDDVGLDPIGSADFLLASRENEGLGPTINRAVAHIKSVNDWYSHPTHGDQNKVAPYIVMCQDDLLYTKDWLSILASRFRAYGMQYPIGFASGIESIEHPVDEKHPLMRGKRPDGILIKSWIRAAQMMGTREYWESMMPIPRFDPETGRVRAKPNDGMGSGVDWWLIRNHENSVVKSGRSCLVMPGLCQHAGYDKSTWLARELPESDADKEKVKG